MRSMLLISIGLLAGCTSGNDVGVILGPAGANTFDDLVAQVDHRNPDAFTYEWDVDGQVLESLTGPTVSASDTRKGEIWTVTVRKGNVVSSASLEIGNAAPSGEVAIEPPRPTAQDTVVAKGSTNDPDGDPAFVTYVWSKYNPETGSFEASRFTSTSLPPTATVRGETWRVIVTPDDGDDKGPSGYLEFKINNGLPDVFKLELNQTVATTNDLLVVDAEATDSDGDDIRLEYQWVVNGVDVPGKSSRTFDGAAVDGFNSGDEVLVKVRGNDGEAGPWRLSPTVKVVNGPPTAPVAAITPVAPYEDEDLLCTLVEGSLDSDPGDTVSYRAEWTVDGAPFTAGTTTNFAGDTVPAAATTSQENWSCNIVAFDNEGNEAVGTATAFVDARSGCADGSTEVDWDVNTEGCVAEESMSWADARDNIGTYCADGWEMAGSDIVNRFLNGSGYTDSWLLAFDGEGCSGKDYYATTDDSSFSSNKSCVWRKAHFKALSSETSTVDGVVCVRSPETDEDNGDGDGEE